MKKNEIYFILLGLLLAFATYKAGALSFARLSDPEACPSLGFIPACYLVLGGYALALLGHLKSYPKLFMSGLAIPTALALFASIAELAGFDVCPKSESGIPLCYFSLAFCAVGWLLWKLNRSKTE